MNIEEAADKAQLSKLPADGHCREPYWTATDDELAAFAQIIGNQALEDAAKCCDARAMKNESACDGEDEEDAISLRSAAWQMSVCAADIRAMKKDQQ